MSYLDRIAEFNADPTRSLIVEPLTEPNSMGQVKVRVKSKPSFFTNPAKISAEKTMLYLGLI